MMQSVFAPTLRTRVCVSPPTLRRDVRLLVDRASDNVQRVEHNRLSVLVLCSLLGTVACGAGQAETDRIPRQRSVDRYVAMLESEGRAEWQKPDALA